MPELPATRTPATADQLRAALELAGPDLSPHQIALLLAHISIETANGKSIIQHNVGNITVPESKEAQVPLWRPPWFETPSPDASDRIKRLHAGMLAGTQPSAFRAYGSLAEGVAAYLSAMRGRFSPMLRAESPGEFVREWRNTAYTPDLDVAATTPNFETLYRKFGGQETSGGATGPLLVGAVAAGLIWHLVRRKTG